MIFKRIRLSGNDVKNLVVQLGTNYLNQTEADKDYRPTAFKVKKLVQHEKYMAMISVHANII